MTTTKKTKFEEYNKTPEAFKNRSKAGKIGGIKAAVTNKLNGTGCFDKKIQSMGGKAGVKVLREKRLGSWFNSEQHLLASKKGKVAQKANKKGFWDSKQQSRLGKRGGCKTTEIMRNRKRIIWKSIFFDSYRECEIAMCIHYQTEHIKESYNYQFKVSTNHIDFFIKKYKCFIELHFPLLHYDNNDTKTKYRNKRRKLLDKNGFRKYKLIVINN